MKQTAIIIFSLILLSSCSNNDANPSEPNDKSNSSDSIEKTDKIGKITESNDENEIPPNGKYVYDMAFAEYQGQSMGEKVSVIIDGNSIKIIYEGGGNLTSAKKGEIFDEGIIMKHKSGDWIIGKKKTDVDLDEIGGCTGGPAIIDFKNKKYWTC